MSLNYFPISLPMEGSVIPGVLRRVRVTRLVNFPDFSNATKRIKITDPVIKFPDMHEEHGAKHPVLQQLKNYLADTFDGMLITLMGGHDSNSTSKAFLAVHWSDYSINSDHFIYENSTYKAGTSTNYLTFPLQQTKLECVYNMNGGSSSGIKNKWWCFGGDMSG